MRLPLFITLSLALSAFAADPIWEGLHPVVPADFEIQATAGRQLPMSEAALRTMARNSLVRVKELNQGSGDSLFHWGTDTSVLKNKTFRLIFTNGGKTKLRLLAEHYEPEFDSYVLAPILGDEQEIAVIVRVDRVFTDKLGNLLPDAQEALTGHLFRQINGYAQVQLERSNSALVGLAGNPEALALVAEEADFKSIASFRRLVNEPLVDSKLSLTERSEFVWQWWIQPPAERVFSGMLPVAPLTGLADRLPEGVDEAFRAPMMRDFKRALTLVYSLPPPDAAQDPFCRQTSVRRMNQSLLVFSLDSRDEEYVRRLAWCHLRSPEIFSPADTALVRPKVGFLAWLVSKIIGLPRKTHTQTVLWQDEVFYDERLQKRSDSLARATLSLAGEFYGAYPNLLLRVASQGESAMDMVYLRQSVLHAADSFRVRLMQNDLLWEQLSLEEQNGFKIAGNQFAHERDAHDCRVRLLRQMGAR